MRLTRINDRLLKIQFGDVYIQIPIDDKEAVQFVLDFLKYAIDEILPRSKEDK